MNQLEFMAAQIRHNRMALLGMLEVYNVTVNHPETTIQQAADRAIRALIEAENEIDNLTRRFPPQTY